MCKNYPKLDELYDLSKNKGYGTANHIKGIDENGISKWHRKSFGICQSKYYRLLIYGRSLYI